MTKFTTKAKKLFRSSVKKIKEVTSPPRKRKRKTVRKKKKIAVGRRTGVRKRKTRAHTAGYMPTTE